MSGRRITALVRPPKTGMSARWNVAATGAAQLVGAPSEGSTAARSIYAPIMQAVVQVRFEGPRRSGSTPAARLPRRTPERRLTRLIGAQRSDEGRAV